MRFRVCWLSAHLETDGLQHTTPPSLEMRDGGSLLPTPTIRLAFRVAKGFFVPAPHHPRSKCEMKGSNANACPPSRVSTGGGLFTTTPPSLAQNARLRVLTPSVSH